MKFLVDTCVVSEWKRKRPDAAVLEWLRQLEMESIYFSVLTIGELMSGILRLPEGRRKEELKEWIAELRHVYAMRVIPLEFREVDAWAAISAEAGKKGLTLSAVDGMLAGTAAANGLAIATRNVDDFLTTGIPIFDPWTNTWHNRK
ncbi:MAG: type II toxin-antitoxin system VapC family toxin [Victivallales bacterium]|nr:type II toxin-antitoxin system VapC family toxin [Victivallales bacterium]